MIYPAGWVGRGILCVCSNKQSRLLCQGCRPVLNFKAMGAEILSQDDEVNP